MKSTCAKKASLFAGLPVIGAGILAGVFLSPRADAGPAPMMDTPPPAPAWKWGVSFDYMYRDVDRTEDYWSGDELWTVDYDDFSGDLWGGTVFVTPPCFWDIMIDFSYRTGDLNGDFENRSLESIDGGSGSPGFGGPYEGDADFDRDEYVVGLTYPFPSMEWLYARLEYFNFQEDGDWNYDDGDVESQEYTLWGVAGGLGANYAYPLGSSGAMLDLNAFLGIVYFDFEHEELDSGGATTDWDDWGFLGRAGVRFSYPIQPRLDVFLGCGYEYVDTDSGSLDMSNQGVFVNLGLKGEF